MQPSQWIFAAFAHQPDLAISFTIYNISHDTTRRDFYLRNLPGQTEAGQIVQAKAIMNQVAEEIHYLTGFGVDKGTIKLNNRKADEVIYPDFKPNPNTHFFHKGALFTFRPVSCYMWVKKHEKRWGISPEDSAEGWQVEVVNRSKATSFRLPIVTIPEWRRREYQPENATFFGEDYQTGRKRKKSGNLLAYDRKDPIFNRFMSRFYEEGHLSFGLYPPR
jgi:hypothetical protein